MKRKPAPLPDKSCVYMSYTRTRGVAYLEYWESNSKWFFQTPDRAIEATKSHVHQIAYAVRGNLKEFKVVTRAEIDGMWNKVRP